MTSEEQKIDALIKNYQMIKAEEPKIVVVGMLPAQEKRLSQAIVNVKFFFIDKERKKVEVPEADLYIVWARFVSHRICGKIENIAKGKLLVHHKGISDLIRVLKMCKKAA